MIEFNLLDRQYRQYENEYKEAAIRVLESGWYILGNELKAFEEEYSSWLGSKYCVGVNSGLDAIIIALKTLGVKEGDEVIVPANTYIASIMGITLNGATPVFIEPDEYYNIDTSKIEAAITKKTKAILVVHLYGQVADMHKIMSLAKKHNIYVIEDCAQAHGAKLNKKNVGTFGDVSCFSFFPTKNIGAFGDAGAIITNKKSLDTKARTIRNYGSRVKYHNEIIGMNSRMDEIQAALLRAKLHHVYELITERQRIAELYLNNIQNDKIELPRIKYDRDSHVFHLFVVRTKGRNKLQKYMLDNGIKTQIHYPIPPHLSECYLELNHKKGDFPITEKYSNQVLSIPLYNGMTQEEMDRVIDVLNRF